MLVKGSFELSVRIIIIYQILWAPRSSTAASGVTTESVSIIACAAIIRSKGSRCSPGKDPARSAWTELMHNSVNESTVQRSIHSEMTVSPCGNFPMRYFVATSHAEAELTDTLLAGSRNKDKQRLVNLSGSDHHQRSVQVSSSSFIFPRPEVHSPADPRKKTLVFLGDSGRPAVLSSFLTALVGRMVFLLLQELFPLLHAPF